MTDPQQRDENLKFQPQSPHCRKCGLVLYGENCWGCNYNLPADQQVKAAVIVPAEELGMKEGEPLKAMCYMEYERVVETRNLLQKWRAHITDVFERKGREGVYQPPSYYPLEEFHTCHGCGGGAGIITHGLCPDCLDQFNQAMGGTADAEK